MKTAWGFRVRQEIAPRLGQSVTGYEGFTDGHARELVTSLEKGADHRPVTATPEDLQAIADEINNAVKDRHNERSLLLRQTLGNSLWLRFYDAVDLLRNPSAVIEADGKLYRFEVRLVPGTKPFEAGGEKAWAFPLHIAPLTPTPGEPGRLIYYVLYPPGSSVTDALIVERVLHGILEFGVLPSVKELTPAQRHSAAYMMEGVVSGEVQKMGTDLLPRLLPGRLFHELLTVPGTAQRLYSNEYRSKAATLRDTIFPIPGSDLSLMIKKYLIDLSISLSQKALNYAPPEPQEISAPTTPTSEITEDPKSLRDRVVDVIGRLIHADRPIIVYDPRRSAADTLDVKDALLAAREGLILPVQDKKSLRLQWSDRGRLIRIGGPNHAAHQSFLFSQSIMFRVEGHPFHLSMTRNTKDEDHFRFVSTEEPDHVRYSPLNVDFTIGQAGGDYSNTRLKNLAAHDFTIHVSKARDGMFNVDVHAHTTHGLLMLWTPPSLTDNRENIRSGQKAFGTEGLTPEQAARFATVLESRRLLKPRLLEREELHAAADVIEGFVKDKHHDPSTIIRSRLGIEMWQNYFHLVDLLRDPDIILQLGDIPYRFEIKAIPGGEPLEFEGEWVWGFPNYTPALEKGKPGMLTLYVPDIDGYYADPSRLEGLIHEGLEYLVFPLHPDLPSHQWHALAVAMEAVTGGIVFTGNSGDPAVISSRIHTELGLNPAHATKLSSDKKRFERKDLIHHQFPPGHSALNRAMHILLHDIADYVYEEARKLEGLHVDMSAKPVTQGLAHATHPDRIAQKAQVIRWIQEHMKLNIHEYFVRDPERNNQTEKFNGADAIVAAQQGLLKLQVTRNDAELQWATPLRMMRLSAIDSVSQDIFFNEEVTFLVGDHQFKLWVDGDYLNSMPQLHFTLLGADEDSQRPELGKFYTVGRRFGNAIFKNAKGLDNTHFTFKVNLSPSGGYRILLRSECADGLLAVWSPPPTASSGSSFTAGFLGLQTIYEMLVRFVRATTRPFAIRVHRPDLSHLFSQAA